MTAKERLQRIVDENGLHSYDWIISETIQATKDIAEEWVKANEVAELRNLVIEVQKGHIAILQQQIELQKKYLNSLGH